MVTPSASVHDAIAAYEAWRDVDEAGVASLRRIAARMCPLPWLAEAINLGGATLTVLGRFDFPSDAGVSWPVCVVQADRPGRGTRPARRVLLRVTRVEDRWAVDAIEPKEVPWGLFRGDRAGRAGVLNGERH